MDQITRVSWHEPVPPLPQSVDLCLIREVFARKNQTDIPRFVPNRKAIIESLAVTNPSAPKAQLLAIVSAARVK